MTPVLTAHPERLPCRVEEMRLRRIDAGKDGRRLGDEAAAGAGAQHLRADLEVDDVVGAERLDDMGLDGQIAVGGLMRDQHAFRPDAERQFCAAPCR